MSQAPSNSLSFAQRVALGAEIKKLRANSAPQVIEKLRKDNGKLRKGMKILYSRMKTLHKKNTILQARMKKLTEENQSLYSRMDRLEAMVKALANK